MAVDSLLDQDYEKLDIVVGRCRLTVSKPVLKPPVIQAIETGI